MSRVIGSRVTPKEYFIFGTLDSRDFAAYITVMDVCRIPEKDMETVSVPGRNGDLIINMGRWKNVEVTYGAAIGTKIFENYKGIIQKLQENQGYQRLEDSIDQDIYRMGYFAGDMKGKMEGRQKAVTFDITFFCKPQKFLISGETPVEFTADTPVDSRILVNPSAQAAKPMILVSGSGSGEISVGEITVVIHDLTDPIYLDCETMNAYAVNGSGVYTNKNSAIYAPEFPVLMPGTTAISWTGGVDRVTITPRWWTL